MLLPRSHRHANEHRLLQRFGQSRWKYRDCYFYSIREHPLYRKVLRLRERERTLVF